MKEVLEWVQSQGAWTPAIFVVVYIVCAVLFIPGSVLTLAAGAIFGVTKGSLLVSLASTTAAVISFLLGRHALRGWVAGKLANRPRFAAIDRAVGKDGWLITFLLRLSPIFPYTLLNYAMGLTRVRLGQYALASWLGMMPGTVMYVYLGSLAGYSAKAGETTTGQKVLYGVGLVATIAVTVVITRASKKALAARLDEPSQD